MAPSLSLMGFVQRIITSESVAWAAQNAVGALFVALFAVVTKMQFVLACLCGVMYSASNQVLSIDRSVGGRLVGGLIFLSSVLSGTILGGALVSLAWLARGEAEGLSSYVPASLSRTFTVPQTEYLVDQVDEVVAGLDRTLARLSTIPLPESVLNLLNALLAFLAQQFGGLVPAVADGFWVLLIVLPILALVPISLARAHKDFTVGLLFAITALFFGAQPIFATMLPAMDLHEFWISIVTGYIKVALVTFGGQVLTGCLVYVQSAHDTVRSCMADVLRHSGARISRLGSAILLQYATADAPKDAEPAAQPAAACDDSLAAKTEAFRLRLRALTAPAGAPKTGSQSCSERARSQAPADQELHSTSLDKTWSTLELAMKSARIEPPWPGLCSQPGADLGKYAALEAQLHLLSAAVAALDEACPEGASLLQGCKEDAAAVCAVLGGALALAAAACARASDALARMPLGRPSAGPGIQWRPLPPATWDAARAELALLARRLAAEYRSAFESLGLEFALSLDVVQGRALAFAVGAADHLLRQVAAVEAAVAAALAVPCQQAEEVPPAEAGKADLEAPLPAEGGQADGMQADGKLADCEPAQGKPADGKLAEGNSASSAESSRAGPSNQLSMMERIKADPYGQNLLILVAFGSGLLVWYLMIKFTLDSLQRIPGLLRSREERWKAYRNPQNRFALKFYVSMSLSIVGIILIMWKSAPDGRNPITDAFEQVRFFVRWQPIYFWLTVAICLQQKVESSVMRALLRTTMTVVGGALGYATMLNGSLANNPYFVVGMFCLVTAVHGLLSPIRELRYSLFLSAFTYAAVVLCQYLGCCDQPGSFQTFAGKVVPTALGTVASILVCWLVWPEYTSDGMLQTQAGALRAAQALLRSITAEVMAAAREQQPPSPAGWMEAVQGRLLKAVADVEKELQLNTVDRKQLPVTWLVLPTPPVVDLMQARLRVLNARIIATINTLAGPSVWSSTGSKSTMQAPAPGPVFASLFSEMEAHVWEVFALYDQLVAACADHLESGRSAAQLKHLRGSTLAALQAAEDGRVALQRSFLQAQPAALAAAGGYSDADFLYLAWLHAGLQCLNELLVIGSTIASAPAQDRDLYFGWLRAWRGIR